MPIWPPTLPSSPLVEGFRETPPDTVLRSPMVSRRGGATRAPREVLQALGVELRETRDSGDLNWCCGGGGGVVTIHRADELRYAAFDLKIRQINATGAEVPVTSCSNCRQTFDDGQAHYKWDKTMSSLLEMVAGQIVD